MRIFFLAILIILASCTSDNIIMTVNGPVPAESTGIMLPHEHLLVDFIGADSTGKHRWQTDSVAKVVKPYLLEYKSLQGALFADCTPAWLGRDPLLLRKLSDETAVQIITNTGFYGAVNNKFIPAFAFSLSAEELSRLWIEEYEMGIENSGVRPGFIKIGVNPDADLSDFHERLVRAAAMTHLQTGLTIVSHTGPNQPAIRQIRILEEEGVDPSAFVWTHAQSGTNPIHAELAAKGAYISLDHISAKDSSEAGYGGSMEFYRDCLVYLKERSLLHKALISHDAGWYRPGEAGGGEFRGFTEIFEDFIPFLLENGFTREDIHQLIVSNPREAFMIRKRLTQKSESGAAIISFFP